MHPGRPEHLRRLRENFHYVVIVAGLLSLLKVYFQNPRDVTFLFVVDLILIAAAIYFVMKFVFGLFDTEK
jgi:hypothetical protein